MAGSEELERLPSGRFPKGVSGNPGGKRRDGPTSKEIQRLAAKMTPSVLLKLKRVVDAMDVRKPSQAGIAAAKMIIDRGYGEPVKETDRILFEAVEGNRRWSFNMSDGDATPALDESADVIDGIATEEEEARRPHGEPSHRRL
jgi:hypothetical protein